MTRCTITAVLVATLSMVGQTRAGLGPAPAGTAVADYVPLTGEVTVSVNGVVNWFITSDSLSLTRDAPANLPGFGGFVSDNDQTIGETGFISMNYTDLLLGKVAATGLPLGDLTISWNETVGGALQTQDVFHIVDSSNNPPTAGISGPFVIDIRGDPLNILLDASSSFDDENISLLTYKWDLDNDGSFEMDTGTTAILAIADVTATFGGIGVYPVAVEVFDGEFIDSISTTVSLTVPEPATLALATLGLTLAIALRRKRNAA